MASFQQLFPTFLQRCADLRNVLMVVAYLLVIVGIIMMATPRPSVRAWSRYWVRLIVVLSLLVNLPQWGDQIQNIVADTVTNPASQPGPDLPSLLENAGHPAAGPR